MTLPLLWPGILAGLMLAFVISLDDVVITNLIAGPGQETLPIYMLAQLRRSTTPEINADLDRPARGLGRCSSPCSFLLSRQKELNRNAPDLSQHCRGLGRPAGAAGSAARGRRTQHLQLGRLHQPRS